MIGDNIRLLRIAKGLSQEQLAERVGISLLAIQYYEENKWRPGTETISRLADALGVTIPDLVGGCDCVCDDDGDLILVRKDCGCHLKVYGKFKRKEC
ncbi:helix-turn-helix domain-containing protein [Sporolituus thermophilus]|uniref:Helix-turn-helix n=1 Tax=Sporolituus thermophilus DSM 23256 TaxID=1123285 RepID=A0A1G7ILL0_9FIRM|nr:helix-turn-helix transcriptional regulator [Sporolituus thermophilus]SDF13533.1 Helix-turn-helix [Sporolituus thermophilus DSM 23256]